MIPHEQSENADLAGVIAMYENPRRLFTWSMKGNIRAGLFLSHSANWLRGSML